VARKDAERDWAQAMEDQVLKAKADAVAAAVGAAISRAHEAMEDQETDEPIDDDPASSATASTTTTTTATTTITTAAAVAIIYRALVVASAAPALECAEPSRPKGPLPLNRRRSLGALFAFPKSVQEARPPPPADVTAAALALLAAPNVSGGSASGPAPVAKRAKASGWAAAKVASEPTAGDAAMVAGQADAAAADAAAALAVLPALTPPLVRRLLALPIALSSHAEVVLARLLAVYAEAAAVDLTTSKILEPATKAAANAAAVAAAASASANTDAATTGAVTSVSAAHQTSGTSAAVMEGAYLDSEGWEGGDGADDEGAEEWPDAELWPQIDHVEDFTVGGPEETAATAAATPAAVAAAAAQSSAAAAAAALAKARALQPISGGAVVRAVERVLENVVRFAAANYGKARPP
jgi:hypothetical protein